MLTGQFLLLQAPTWTPFSLGAKLIAWWDAERSDLVTRAGGLVSSWRDVVAGYNITQSTGASKPTYSATSFNSRPGLTFDGTDDVVFLDGVAAAIPNGAAPSWMWGIAAQDRAAASATTGTVLQYGSSTVTNSTRRIARVQLSAENRLQAFVGAGGGSAAGSNNTSVVYAGRHVVVGKVSGTHIQGDIDGIAGPSAAQVSNTTAGERLAIGGAVNGGNIFLGVINSVLVTLPLTAAEEALMYAYFNRRI